MVRTSDYHSEVSIRTDLTRIMLVFILLALLFSVSINAAYRFRVPENRVLIQVNTDASITINYSITFENLGQPIDIIDVGMPDKRYGNVSADLDGTTMTDIRKSTVLASGVEVHLHGKTIPAGSTGTLHLRATTRGRVFTDSKDPSYASVVFSPTWYGSEYTTGTTHLVCEFAFPSGVGLNEPRYHKKPYNSVTERDGRVVYTWDIPSASPSRQYVFGASFPARVMSRVAKAPPPPNVLQKAISGIFTLIFSSLPCMFGAFMVFIVFISIFGQRKRRMQYLPPKVGMEGVEVRRGLTVPEVAVLMQKPVNEVMALVLFGMIRKELVRVKSRSPLVLEAAKDKSTKVDYEKSLVEAVKDDGKIDEDEAARVLTDLIKRVKQKIKGFSRKKSLLYYRDIMRRAWEKVGKDDYSEAFEWMVLDKDFTSKARTRFGDSPVPLPVWWMPMYTHSSPVPHSAAPAGGSPVPGPVASANSIVSSMESFSHSLVNSVPGLATKVTSQTNPVPVSSGHSGGGCACACAGCACACAGGGR